MRSVPFGAQVPNQARLMPRTEASATAELLSVLTAVGLHCDTCAPTQLLLPSCSPVRRLRATCTQWMFSVHLAPALQALCRA